MRSRLPTSRYAYARFDISGSDLWYHHHWYGRGAHVSRVVGRDIWGLERAVSGERMMVSVLLFALVV